jgi:hypothetical protein
MKKLALFLILILTALVSFSQTYTSRRLYGNYQFVVCDTTSCDTIFLYPSAGITTKSGKVSITGADTALSVHGVSSFNDAYVNLYNGNWIVRDYTNNEQLTWGAHVQRGWNLSNEALYYNLSPGGLEIGASDTDFCKIYGDSIVLGGRIGELGTSAKITSNAFYTNLAQGLEIYDGIYPNLIMSIGTDSSITMSGTLSVYGELSGNTLFTRSADVDGDLTITGKLNGLVYNSDSVLTADDASIVLTNGIYGWGEVYAFNAGAIDEWAEFIISSDGAVYLKSNSTDVVNTDTDNKLCIFDNGSGVTIRNRLGNARTIKYIIHH